MTEKKDTAAAKAPAKKPEPKQATLSLHEFCMRLSETDSRVGLLSAFEYTERAAGRLNDTEAAYRDRFAKFITKPV